MLIDVEIRLIDVVNLKQPHINVFSTSPCLLAEARPENLYVVIGEYVVIKV